MAWAVMDGGETETSVENIVQTLRKVDRGRL